MSYRVRYTTPSGIKGRWARDYATREDAQRAIDNHVVHTGFTYTVEEVPEPGSTAAHHVEILRERVKELETELAEAKASLAKAPSVPVGASEAPREGGDSGSSSFEALEAFLRADTCRSIQAIEDGRFIVLIPGYIGSPASRTLKGIAARVEEMTKSNAKWLKPISRPKDKFGEGTNRWRLNALERFLDGDDAASLTWHEGEFHAVAEDVAITAPTLLAIADNLAEKASEEPGEGGDSDRRRLEALERWLKGNTQRLVYFSKRQLLVAISDSIMGDAAAPTLSALADKLAEKEGKP